MLLGPPVAGGAAARRRAAVPALVGWTSAVLSLSSHRAAALLWRSVLARRRVHLGAGEFLRADALSTLARAVRQHRGALAAWLGPGLGAGRRLRRRAGPPVPDLRQPVHVHDARRGHRRTTSRFMWVAIEATTITSAMLIPLHVDEGVGRGVVEIHPDRLGRHRAGLRRHRARVLRLRRRWRARCPAAQLDACCAAPRRRCIPS